LLICRQIGARVWVTSRSDTKLARARELGAEETINVATQDVAREVRARSHRRGVDVVLDSVGTATWAGSLGALRRGGRLVTCGATSGPMVETDARRLFWNQWTIMGSTMGNDAEFDAVVAQFRDGHLLPPIDRVYSLAEGNAAFERLQHAEQFGKIVLTI
jgi:NADPH:quinone reductase-like Zn-dependent oxidoreductase